MNNKPYITISNPADMFRKLFDKDSRAPVQVYSNKNRSYPELHLFKSQIELDGNGPLHKPYSSAKASVLLYRAIFLSIGVLYFFLGIFLYSKSLTWTCSLLFGSSFLVKALLCSVCAASSLYCIVLGFLLKPEREAVKKVYRQSKARLLSTFERKALSHGIKGYYLYGKEYRRALALRQTYNEAAEKMHEHKDEANLLVQRIAGSNTFDEAQKEELFNQAILELKDKLDNIICNFKDSSPQTLQLT